MKFFQMEDRRIHYQLENFAPEHPEPEQAGHTIVFIHGLGQDLRCWDPIIQHLTQYRIIRYDIAGHGASGFPSGGVYQLHTFSDELYALLRYLNVERVTLYGFELGACIAMHFASHYPDYTERIISVAHPVYYPDSIRHKKYERIQTCMSLGLEQYVEDVLPSITYKPDSDSLRNAYKNVSMNTYRAVIQLLKDADLVEDFKRNCRPVLQLAGDMDTMFPPQLMFQAIQYFPSTILVQIPNAKSLVHFDNPEYTAKRIDAFITQYTTNLTNPLAREASLYYEALMKKNKEHAEIDHCLRIDVIHRFEVRLDGRLLVGNWKIRKAQELIIYLLIHKNVHREKLYDLFWPHLNLENAQNMLRVSINHLKKLVDKPNGTAFIQSKRDRIELVGNTESDLLDLLNDIKRFHSCQDNSEKEMIGRRIGQAVTPNMLEGYYNDWIMSLRDEIYYAAAPIIRWVANLYESQNRLLDSILYYKLMLKLMPEELELIQKIAQLYESLHLKGIAGEWQDKYDRAISGEE